MKESVHFALQQSRKRYQLQSWSVLEGKVHPEEDKSVEYEVAWGLGRAKGRGAAQVKF